MLSAKITVDPTLVIGPVRPRTFGSFVEHLGRCVYTGIYEPGHATADKDGFRQDVAALVRELGVTTVRYPGGNFVSGYRWEDGIGPQGERPARLDLAWHTTETNQVGIDEFMAWVRSVQVEPMLAVNLGTRGIHEALDLLEYCNIAGGTHLSQLRRTNASADAPYGVSMWCLGNEMDGPWQVGHKTPQEYGRLAAETARAMRMMDPTLELVACGSSGTKMPTFGAWEHGVLMECYDEVDLISAHAYYQENDGDLASFLASAVDMDHFIDAVTATADAVRAAKKADKRIGVAFDEWNVWYQDAESSRPPEGDDWPVAPALLEDQYSVADAVVVGGLLISLLRHTDRVHEASLAQLVNVIAPIRTEPGGPAWRQTIFHPFALTARRAAGEVVTISIDAPTYETNEYGDVPLVDAVVTHDRATGRASVFVVNRSVNQELRLELALPGATVDTSVDALTYCNRDVYWKATKDDADAVKPLVNASAHAVNGGAEIVLPPVSWSVLTLG